MKLIKYFLLFVIVLLITTCKDNIVQPVSERVGGYAITFDDTYIKEWNAIRGLLKKYDAKATFFISAYHTINDADKLLLDSLKLDGHEIACHSVNHFNVIKFLETHTITEYLNVDIIPAINLMTGDGNIPKSFSYPYGMNSAFTDSVLLGYFDILRDVAEVQRHTENVTHIDTIESIFYKYDNSKVVAGLGIDANFNIPINEIENGFKRAVQNKEVIVFYAHLPVETVTRNYQTSYAYLEEVLSLAQKLKLRSFTFNELAK